MSVHTSAGDERRWAAWAGDLDRLSRLAKVMDDLIAPEREEADRVIAEELDRLAKDIEEAHEERAAHREEYNADRLRSAAAMKWDSTLEVFEKELSIKHEGRPDAVLASIDPLTIHRATLSSPGRVGDVNRSQVDLSNEGCAPRVSGTDPKWVRMAMGTISAEIERGVPRWHWLRSDVAQLFYGVVLGVPTFVLLLTVPDWIDEETGELTVLWGRVLLSGLVGFILVGILGAALVLGAARRVLPGFEILGPGERGRGGRVLAFLGVQALAVALAVVFYLLEN